MRRSDLLRLISILILNVTVAGHIAAEDATAAPAATSVPSQNSSDFFGLDKLHQIHLKLSAEEWEAMQPIERRGNDDERPSNQAAEKRKVHKDKFPWAVGSMTIGGKELEQVGVRYKGNATFALSRGNLKRNLKIKLDWTNDDQRYSGIKTLNLNAGGMDPSRVREALSYSAFRAAGTPASRTAYAEVTLSIPGKYNNEHLGIYVLVEQVNKSFLKDRFKRKDGMLLKPQGVASVDYLGDNWDAYASRYHPDDEPSASQTNRLIEFARLVNGADDDQFRAKIDAYLDIDGFLRYSAINFMLVNLDCPPAMGQNYYVYLHPETEKFIFFPWDLDISLAGWPLGGSPEQQMKLSLTRPNADGYKLFDRLLAIDGMKAKYDRLLNELANDCFSEARLSRELDILEKTTKAPLARETAATASRNEPGYRSPIRDFLPPDPRTFVARRTESIAKQLDGKSEGYVFTKKHPPFGRRQLAIHIHVQADTNKDRALSKDELVALMSQWFDAIDKDQSGNVNKKDFIASLPDAFFPPDFPHAPPKGIPIPEPYVAEGLFTAADSDHDGIATKESMTKTFGDWFESWETKNQGKLTGREIYGGLKQTMSAN